LAQIAPDIRCIVGFACDETIAIFHGTVTDNWGGDVMRLLLGILCFLISIMSIGQARAEKRVAFVVGIDKYDNLGSRGQLQRAVTDARSVKATFSSLGFEVMLAENSPRALFNVQWQRFLDRVSAGDTAVLYFSGHGVEIEGLNYLLPRDVPNINYGRQEQLKRESISVSELLLDLRRRKPQVTLVILDACRDHPLIPDELRSSSSPAGLAKMEAPTGTFIMYSAGTGETALDRLPKTDPDRNNSVYTRKLLPLLKMPGLSLSEVAQQVRSEVHALAATVPHTQTPAYYDGLIRRYCVAGCNDASPAQPSAMPSSINAKPEQNWAAEGWPLVKDSNSILQLEAYVSRFPGTFYADLARARIEELKQTQLAVLAPRTAEPHDIYKKRIALVIGNGAYEHSSRLLNPANDAVDIAAALRTRGFEVMEGLDLNKDGMDRKVRDFASALHEADIGVFYYAGHALQIGGRNYLLPTDAQLMSGATLEFETMRVDMILRIMERQTNTNIFILDAARENPLGRSLPKVEVEGRGLAALEAGIGTLVSFSTQPGNIALDGSGRNSPFAEALTRHISSSKDDLSAILIAVRNDVMKETKRKQVPWEHSALTGRVYFSSPPK
jgi:uncharacterized caspase-like protein